MITSYFTIASEINGETKTCGFYLESEIDTAMEDLDKMAEKLFGDNFVPCEDGTIGFMIPGGIIYLSEKELV